MALQKVDRIASQEITAVSYHDDTHFVAKAKSMQAAWGDITDKLAAAGHEVVMKKSALFIPAASEDISPAAKALADDLPRKLEGITLLGTEATSKQEDLQVGKTGIMLGTAKERVQACKDFCEELVQLASSGLHPAARHMAWTLLANSAVRALDFDARLCSPWTWRSV